MNNIFLFIELREGDINVGPIFNFFRELFSFE